MPPKNFMFDYKVSQGYFCRQQVIKTPIAWAAFLIVVGYQIFPGLVFESIQKANCLSSQQNEIYMGPIVYIIIAVAKGTRIYVLHIFISLSSSINNLTIFDQKYNQIEASCMKWQKCNKHASLREKGLPLSLEVAAYQANTRERSKTQVTKDNSTIMARDKRQEGQKSSHLEYLGGQKDFSLSTGNYVA